MVLKKSFTRCLLNLENKININGSFLNELNGLKKTFTKYPVEPT